MVLAGKTGFLLHLGMAEKLEVSLLQQDLKWEDAEVNREMFRREIEKLSEDVDLIVLPEMFTTGFSMSAENLSEPHCGPSFRWMQEMAAEMDAAVTGSLIVKETGHYYNRLYFVFPDGNFQTYDKRHTFTFAGEHRIYTAGTEKAVIIFRGWRICPLVCYDLRFPVWSRNQEDYDLLVYVANWPAPRTEAWDTLLKARAIENMSYCIGVNRVGRDGNGLDYLGHSMIYDTLGKSLSDDFTKTPGVVQATLLKEHIRENRSRFGFLQDRDSFTLK